jgi:hypothetical protein
MNGNSICFFDNLICFFFIEGQQQYNDPYSSQRYRYGGSRNNRGSYRYNTGNNNNNSNEYYEETYDSSGQYQQIPTKRSQQTSSNNGVESTSETINGSGSKGQRTSKQQSNGVI